MLVVAGLDASTRFDCQLHLDASADRLRVVAPVDTNGDILAQVMRAFPRATAIKQLEETPVPDYRRQLCGDANAATERITVGSGALAKHLVELATISDSDATSTLPPFACLFVYGVEGNNIPEAAILARAALDMMGGGSGHNGEVQQQQQQASIKFRLPASWQYMYGGSMDTLLYQ